jgi:pretoxin HINT domain-containing protein
MEAIKPHDVIAAHDVKTGRSVSASVRRRRVQTVSEVVVLHLAKGEAIITTPRQPFLTKSGRFVRAADLKLGDSLKTDGHRTVKVMEVLRKKERTPVHALQLNGASTYRVGLQGVVTALDKNEHLPEELPIEEEDFVGKTRPQRPEIGPRPGKRAASKGRTRPSKKGGASVKR